MTSLPAMRLGLAGLRGCLAVGCHADVVVFDAETVGSDATFEAPHQYARGISTVIVNGAPVVVGGLFTGVRPGRVLRRQ
jgi:N-acyl-D-amino-acid deacylase